MHGNYNLLHVASAKGPKLRTVYALLILFVCLSANGYAQLQLVCEPAPVKGRVAGPTGDPVPGARVVVLNDPYCVDIEWKASRPEENNLIGEATTDAAGRFKIDWKVHEVSTIENANVQGQLLVFAPGYAISSRSFSMWYPQNFEIKLKDEVEHEGTVLDDQGQPLADAEVLLDCIYNDPSMINFVSSNSEVTCLLHSSIRPRVRTNQAGVYRMTGLASKQIVLLQIRHPKFRSIRSLQPVDDASPTEIEPGQERNPFGEWHKHYGRPIRMPSEQKIVMTAIDQATKKPIEGLEVCSFFSGSATRTDQDGKFEYFPLPNEYRRQHNELVVRMPGQKTWMPVGGRAATTDNPTRLFVPKLKTIVGTVVDDQTNHGVEGVAVYIGRPESPGFNETYTDKEGRFSLTTFSTGVRVSLNGPKLGYVLPVRKQTSAAEESSGKEIPEIHTRQATFRGDEDSAELHFSLPRYPKVRVRIVDSMGKPVAKMIAQMSANYSLTLPVSSTESGEDGIVEFDIDRPIIHSSVWVACATGVGIVAINGMPDEVPTLKLEPAIPIKGHLTIEDREGNVRDASDLLIYGELVDSKAWSQISLATTDKTGHYTIYLPQAEGNFVNLYVRRISDISKQSWKVELSEQANGDFTIME